ncbi:MAG: helix-turn-helix domain-containing protein [Blastocatellia bacterium]
MTENPDKSNPEPRRKRTDHIALQAAHAKLEAEGHEIEWTAQEAAAYLKISTNLIYLMCHRREIPHRKINLPGRERPLFRFRKSEIEAWREKYSTVVTLDESKR